MKEMYRRAQKAANGKKVLITESGWPSAGTPFGSAVPSVEHAMRYFINAQEWARQEEIELFYFSSFNEAWKIDAEGDVGAYWGIWDTHGNQKF
jgi:exo-beta-1,3-glucanase (GH17 family)